MSSSLTKLAVLPRRLSAAVLLAMVGGCSSPASPDNDINVETSVSATTIRPGEPSTVTVVVTNRGRESRKISGNSGFCPSAPFVVIMGDGAVVRPASTCIALGTLPGELSPGESVTLTAEWHGDLKPDATMEPTTLLPAGSYRVRGSVYVVGLGLVDGASVEVRIVR